MPLPTWIKVTLHIGRKYQAFQLGNSWWPLKKYKRLVANNLLYTVCMKNVDHLKFKLSATWCIKGAVIQCNFSCNLQRNSTFERCKIGKYLFPSQLANIFLTYQKFVSNLHLLRVELRCKLQGNLRRVTGP